ncbi:hypothetical protein HY489_04645 [Candidatus Woesearchaeota archaeon]|nr:hypothetical protein [Candidatus Woesearchaeota archaeon]
MISLYDEICDYKNLESAFKKARKGKTKRMYVKAFEALLEDNLLKLQHELVNHTYSPRPLESFILRDGKTRRISRSDFRDRVVHHALCNVIEPILEKGFIFDSFANRKGKGVLKALERFDFFKRKVSKNHTRECFVLKADIRRYFDNVDHNKLLQIIAKRLSDERMLWLIRQILGNFKTTEGKGMPLGNLTSQFFANVYLNWLDQFVKHILKARYYIRYVDDFVILSNSKAELEFYKRQIGDFLEDHLLLQLHPDKSRIIKLQQGVPFLGMRVFPFHRLLLRKNLDKFKRKWRVFGKHLDSENYDETYVFIEGWLAFAKTANTFGLRKRIIRDFENASMNFISIKDVNRYLKEEKIFKLS